MTDEQDNSSEPVDSLDREKKIDFSIKMRNAALDCAAKRQVYEWKFCILIWTAIGGLIGVLLVNKVALDREVLDTGQLLLLGSITIIIVIGFQICCVLATHVDKRRAEMYEDIINDDLGITEENKEEFNKALKRIKWAKGLWSPILQIAVTATLLWAFGCVYSAIPTNKEKESNDPKPSVKNVAGIIIDNGK